VSTPQRDAQNVFNEAQKDAGFLRSMKFNKGHFYIDDVEVPLGTRFSAHCVGWKKVWLKFGEGKLLARKEYIVADGDKAPDRDQLDDNDQLQWKFSPKFNKPMDPWVLQYQLPLETEGGDYVIFITSSIGGRRGVADICTIWARKAGRDPNAGQPFVKIRETIMPTSYGGTQRPLFEVDGWDTIGQAVRTIEGKVKEDDMNDEIPF
jgi:hypothetical protein